MGKFKKIVALAAGLGMLGATLSGALAAPWTLDNYPKALGSPVTIVFGKDADVSDVVGATELASALKYEEETTTTTAATVSEGVLIKAAGEELNYNEDFEDIISTLDKSDLDILADGTYDDNEGDNENTVTYTQEIAFVNGTNKLVFEVDENEDNEPVGSYIKLVRDEAAYNYTLEFDDAVTYENTSNTDVGNDLEDTELMILGSTYTIVDAKVSSGQLNYLKLFGGVMEITIKEEETKTVQIDDTSYEITCKEVWTSSGNEVYAIFEVNGEESSKLSEGQSDEVSGLRIALKTAVDEEAGEGEDWATLYVGANVVELEDGEKVKVNGEELDGSEVSFDISSTAKNEWEGFSIWYAPDDDVWIGEGEEWTDPIFGRFKYVFAGLEKNTEDIAIDASGGDATLTFKNNGGDTLEIPFVANDSGAVFPGDDLVKDGVYTRQGGANQIEKGGNLLIANGDYCNASGTGKDVTDCEGIQLLVISSGNEARIIEVKDINTADHTVDLKDLTTGSTWDDKDYTSSIKLWGGVSITLSITNSTGGTGGTMTILNASSIQSGNYIETSLGGNVTLGFDGTYSRVYLRHDTSELFQIKLYNDGDGNIEMTPEKPTTTNWDEQEKDSDIKMALDYSDYGALGTWDSDNKDDLTIEYPEEEVYADVYVTPISATLVAGTNVEVKTVDAVSKLDSEVGNIAGVTTDGVILIGGPCVNTLTAEAMGKTYPACGADSGIPENKGIIKAYEVGDKKVLLVAGWSADDTRRACLALKYPTYKDWGLTGTEAEVTGTSLSDISVTTV